MTREEIFSKVSGALVVALNVDEEDVRPTAILERDLGAYSIDFLDIVFRLELEFSIKIPRGELFPEAIFQGDPAYVYQGRVTARGIQELRTRMPYADLTEFAKDLCLDRVAELYTVGMICRYIEHKLGVTT